MEILKEIAYTLTRYQVRQVDVITNPDTKPSKKDNRYWEAYCGLREQQWQNDADMAQHFGMEYPSKNYNRFKNELKDRLWNTLLFTEGIGRDYTEYTAVYHELLQKWSIAEILKQRGALKAFWELSNNCLALAQKYEFSKIIVDVTTSMKSSAFLAPMLKKEYQRIKAIYQEYWPIFLAETALRNDYEMLISELAVAKGYKKDFAPLAEQLVAQHKEAASQCHTVIFQFQYRLIQFYSKAMVHDWESALEVANQALEFFESKKFNIPAHLIGFYHQKVSCLLMLDKYDEAKTVLDDALKLTAADSSHHFKNRELATVNALYATRYDEAWQICKSALQHERFAKIPLIDQEAWRIYYGYLYFLAQTQRFELSQQEKNSLPKLRLSTWLNDLPLYSLDKRGAQIPVLILQTLLLFSESRWDELENRIEALRKFRQRNLDPENEHYRTNCFIHLLELLPKYAHDLRSLPAAAAPWLKKLAAGDFDILDRTYEIEVVPYERQWEWILEMAAPANKAARPQPSVLLV